VTECWANCRARPSLTVSDGARKEATCRNHLSPILNEYLATNQVVTVERIMR